MYRPGHIRAAKNATWRESAWNEVMGRTGVLVSGGRANSRSCLGLVPAHGASKPVLAPSYVPRRNDRG